MKIIKKGIIGILSVLMLLVILLLVPYTKARLIMGSLTHIEKIKMHQMFEFDIPTKGLKWFPDMIWFDASDGFNRLNHTDLSLTILYSYGDFKEGTSSIFDKNSPYYASFFGAYVIEDTLFPKTLDELALIPIYDYENLILRDLGDPNYKNAFQYEVVAIQNDVKYMASESWKKVDIDIQTHGLWHQKDEFLNHYIQFGIPKEDPSRTDFEDVNLKGRLYFKRVDSKFTVVMYIIARDLELLEQTDDQLLSKSIFKLHK